MTIAEFAAKYGLFFIAGFLVYFLPSFVAAFRVTRYTLGIVALNVLAGWTLLGWGAALIWALCAPKLGDGGDRVLDVDVYECPKCEDTYSFFRRDTPGGITMVRAPRCRNPACAGARLVFVELLTVKEPGPGSAA